MKKYFYLGISLCVSLAFTACKSSESAYKKAYEKAKAQEGESYQTTPTVAPVTPVVTPTTPTTSPSSEYVNSAPVRSENVTIVSGSGLNKYSVVCGSFSVRANAESAQKTLNNAGYQAQIAYNAGNNMYRVIASTFADKHDAVVSRDKLRGTYPDAWLLYKQ